MGNWQSTVAIVESSFLLFFDGKMLKLQLKYWKMDYYFREFALRITMATDDGLKYQRVTHCSLPLVGNSTIYCFAPKLYDIVVSPRGKISSPLVSRTRELISFTVINYIQITSLGRGLGWIELIIRLNIQLNFTNINTKLSSLSSSWVRRWCVWNSRCQGLGLICSSPDLTGIACD